MLMRHPNIAKPAHVTSEAVFEQVWAPKGWKLVDKDTPVPEAPDSHRRPDDKDTPVPDAPDSHRRPDDDPTGKPETPDAPRTAKRPPSTPTTTGTTDSKPEEA